MLAKKMEAVRFVLERSGTRKICENLFHIMYNKDRALLIEHKHLWYPDDYTYFRYFAKRMNDQELYDLIPQTPI